MPTGGPRHLLTPAQILERQTTPARSGNPRSTTASLVEGLEQSFAYTVHGSSEIDEHELVIAGTKVQLRSPDSHMLGRLRRAFAHLPVSGDLAPELTINIWDSAVLGAPPPPLPPVEGEQAPGAFFYYSDDRVRVGYQLGTSGDARVLAVFPGAPTPALSALDTDRNVAWYWVEDARRIPYWEEATPLRYILDWWFRDRGVHQLHAGAVGTREGGVLLVGKSGSGKSTSTLATLTSSLCYAGDDYVAVSLDPEPRVHSLYCSGKLMADHVRRLPFLVPALSNEEKLAEEKAVVYISEQFPAHATVGFPLRAIVAPRVVRGLTRSRMVAASPAAGLAALAPSTVFQMHTRGKDSFARMRRLAELVPSFVLELGSEMESIPDAISTLLVRLNAHG